MGVNPSCYIAGLITSGRPGQRFPGRRQEQQPRVRRQELRRVPTIILEKGSFILQLRNTALSKFSPASCGANHRQERS